jgi:4-methoxybenzoate monooxygenase (O-demethylating)
MREPAVLDIDPYSVEALTDPYPFFTELREAGPIVKLKRYDVYAVGRYEEGKTVLVDHDRFTAKGGIGITDIRKPGGHFRIPNRLLENDPPSHTGIRNTLTRILTPIVIRRWRDHFEKEAESLADKIMERRDFDGVEDVAEPYILKVFAEAVGISLPRENARVIGEMGFNQAGPDNALLRAALKRAEPYLEWYERSFERSNLVPGSITYMIYEAADRGEFEPDVAANLCRIFVRGGADTTIAGLGFTLNQLARNPDQWAILKSDPSKARNAFEEAIRHESPSYVNYRTTTGPTELGGCALEGDMKIGVFLGACNRDPRQWDEPDSFDVRRESAGVHIAFGHSTHTCIGQMIARLEAECMVKALVKRGERLVPAGEPRYHPVNQLHGLDRLPLRLDS